MKRQKRLKRFKTWREVSIYLDDLVWKTDRLLVWSLPGPMPRELGRKLKAAISALSYAGSIVGEAQDELNEARQKIELRAACARLRARGVPELPGHVKAELKRGHLR